MLASKIDNFIDLFTYFNGLGIGSFHLSFFAIILVNYSKFILCPCACISNFLINLMFLIQIGVVIEDKDFVDSFMDGRPWKAGRFAYSLRLSLWSEHLGLRAREVSSYEDIV